MRTTPPASKPYLLLLLVLAAILSPTRTTPVVHGSTTTTVVHAATVTTVTPGRSTSSRADTQHQQQQLAKAAPAPGAPLQSTAARDARPPSPRLLLVQRPRPPTWSYVGSPVEAPIGRSPPATAGT